MDGTPYSLCSCYDKHSSKNGEVCVSSSLADSLNATQNRCFDERHGGCGSSAACVCVWGGTRPSVLDDSFKDVRGRAMHCFSLRARNSVEQHERVCLVDSDPQQ